MGGVDQTRIKVIRSRVFAVGSFFLQPLCTVITFVLHISGLSVFTWMLVEGIQLYSKIVKVFGSENSKTWIMFVIGYGI